METGFWSAIDQLVAESRVQIDRPKGSAHPKFPDCIYPVDYGYLAGTSSMDEEGIDLWLGTSGSNQVCAVICTVDLLKRDSEIKLLISCTPEEVQRIMTFHNDSPYMKGILIERKV